MPKAKGAAAATPPKTRSAKKTTPTAEEIQVRAYEIYLERRGAPGNPLEDWVRAEHELVARYDTKAARAARTPKRQAA